MQSKEDDKFYPSKTTGNNDAQQPLQGSES